MRRARVAAARLWLSDPLADIAVRLLDWSITLRGGR